MEVVPRVRDIEKIFPSIPVYWSAGTMPSKYTKNFPMLDMAYD